jgi:dolichol kinase
VRLHRGGRLRGWLGARFGGGYELGDRIWRRFLHGLGAFAVLYLLVPPRILVVVSNEVVLLVALELILVVEYLRHVKHWELPTIRPYEEGRIASYVYYAVALSAALLLFPRPVAGAVILGTALVDPLLGELRLRSTWPLGSVVPGLIVYSILAAAAFLLLGGWRGAVVLVLAVLAALLAVAAERPRWGSVDDDLAMTLVPGVVLTAILLVWPGVV